MDSFAVQMLLLVLLLNFGTARSGRPCTTEGEMTVNPDDCSKFDTCNHGRIVTRDCAPTTIYSEKYHTCIPGKCPPAAEKQSHPGSFAHHQPPEPEKMTKFTSPSSSSSCEEHGKMTANPDDCTKFDTCVFSQIVTRSCPPYTIFSERLMTCIYGQCEQQMEKMMMMMRPEMLTELPEPEAEPTVCPNVKKADIVILVDQSTSVEKSGWKSQVQFLVKMIGGLPIGPDAVQIGMIKFSTKAELVFPLNQFKDLGSMERKVKSMSFGGGVTFTHSALKMGAEYLTEAKGARPKTQKVLIVLTDGASNKPKETMSEAQKLHKANIKVIAIGVGQTNRDELKAIATDEKYVLHTDNTDELVKNNFIMEKVLDSIKCITKCTPVEMADVVFLVDSSASILPSGFKDEKFFIKSLINLLDVDKSKVRVGLVNFSDRVKEVINFSDDQNKQILITKVDSMKWIKRTTNTHLGLEKVRLRSFAAGATRSGVPHLLIVLTDGASSEGSLTLQEAQKVKASGIKVIAIGVGEKVKMSELQAIASERRFILLAKDFNELKNLNFIKNEVIQSMSCVVTEA